MDVLEGVGAIGLGDPLPELHDVLQAIGHPGVGRLSVAAGASRFLIVGLDRFRQVEVGDEAYVRLVDAHAEGDGRHDDDAVVAQEFRLRSGADRRIEPGVIGERLAAFRR